MPAANRRQCLPFRSVDSQARHVSASAASTANALRCRLRSTGNGNQVITSFGGLGRRSPAIISPAPAISAPTDAATQGRKHFTSGAAVRNGQLFLHRFPHCLAAPSLPHTTTPTCPNHQALTQDSLAGLSSWARSPQLRVPWLPSKPEFHPWPTDSMASRAPPYAFTTLP